MQLKYAQKLLAGFEMTLPPQKLYPHGLAGAPQVLTGGAGFCVGLTGGAVATGRGVAACVGLTVAVAIGVGVGVAVGVGVGVAVDEAFAVDVAVATGASLVNGAPPPTPPGFAARLVGPVVGAGASEPAHAHDETNKRATMPQPPMTVARLAELSSGRRDLMFQPLAINRTMKRLASPRKAVPGLPMDPNIHRANSE